MIVLGLLVLLVMRDPVIHVLELPQLFLTSEIAE